MLNKPSEGVKKITIDKILLIEAKKPQDRIRKVDVNGTNCFSVWIVFRCRVKQLFRVIVMESSKTAIGSSIPKKLFCSLKTASKPPVVLVIVCANKSRIICPAT